MSDWKAVYSWDFALKGLDQHSGAQLDEKEWFNKPLRAAYAEGKLPRERLSDMVRRILRSIYAVGLDHPAELPPVDLTAHRDAALQVEREGIVLLQNNGVLPITATTRRIAVIGGHADLGVLAGGGSSQVTPPRGPAAVIPLGGEGPLAVVRREVYFPPSPLAELKKLLPKSQITYDPGMYIADAVALARRSDVVIVFATKFESEGFDSPDLTLPFGQDALIDAVAGANPRAIVVLETGNPTSMPWRGRVAAILQAWYPGEAGGQAIAEILTGVVNPTGRLPITFPVGVQQRPRPAMPGFGTPLGTPLTIHYNEGANVGYRWLAHTGAKPLFAFGYGLSYTSFNYGDFGVTGGETISASFTVTNTGDRDGADVPQLYLTEAPGERRRRLLAFERVEVHSAETRRVELTTDPRLLARFDANDSRWHIAEGTYRVALARSADDVVLTADARLSAQSFALRGARAAPPTPAPRATHDRDVIDRVTY
jgi:beta-glucosidase